MKALILAAGRGRRLGDKKGDVNKCMLEFGGKPVLEYNLDRAADLKDLKKIIITVGYRAKDIIDRYGDSFRGKPIEYVFQRQQKGLVHAIESSIKSIGGDDFFLLLGDEILIGSRHGEMYQKFRKEKLFGVCGVCITKDRSKISRTYTVISDKDSRIFRLIEKPMKALNDYQGTGHCIFKNKILSYIDRTPIHPERGEKELPDLIQVAVDNGHKIKIFPVCKKYTNINTEKDLREAEILMKKLK